MLHNDDFNTMEHVVEILLKTIPTLNKVQATEIMLEAHHQGAAVIKVTSQLEAEAFSKQLQLSGLSSSIGSHTAE